ncbi:LPS export ABC transporter periplasmic protein LptC [Utexia brackfieldae]|uniref:LPS export ABC transporter periplasmic protein LptC n=1 Tax=Utexia brackfieldae TaxID=3074108 RepID=UPI00370DCE75
MSKRNIIYGLLIILAVCVYYYFSPTQTQQMPSTLDISQSPTYQSQAMVTTIYDPAGEVIYKITAQQVSHFADNGDTYFVQPDLTLYNQNKTLSWNIQAKEARLSKARVLYLNGEVKLINLVPNDQLERITTESAEVNLITQTVKSDDQVTIDGVGFYSTGQKLTGNLKTKTAKLLENVKTFYNN